ncbi:MAG: thermonuclease family protein [Candidatus Lokiarchaeota archaeon]|nr:thermonuclease family protein [Candidatus Lokiarchaeota archaeon]
MDKKKVVIIFILIISIGIVGIFISVVLFSIPHEVPPPAASEIEIDASGTVYNIVDGDRYDQSGLSDGDRVRLADIDAPESDINAENYLSSLIYDKFVYVDIDDIYGKGYYDRWICVVYVRHNSTHVLNVNYAMVLNGYAVIDNYYNEFNPYDWKLYYYHKV